MLTKFIYNSYTHWFQVPMLQKIKQSIIDVSQSHINVCLPKYCTTKDACKISVSFIDIRCLMKWTFKQFTSMINHTIFCETGPGSYLSSSFLRSSSSRSRLTFSSLCCSSASSFSLSKRLFLMALSDKCFVLSKSTCK